MRLFRSSVVRVALLGVSFAMVTPAAPLVSAGVGALRAGQFRRPCGQAAARCGQCIVHSDGHGQEWRTGPGAGPEVPIFPPGSPFEQFFKDFLNRNHGGQGRRCGGDSPPAARRAQSLGSGFIVDPAGYVVTNNHVIEGADEVSVTLQDNTVLKAEIVGRDESGDIALLKVKTDKPLTTVEFGDSDAVAGRRLGAGDRQSVRAGRHGDGGHRFGARPRHPSGPIRRLHPDRRGDQPRQLGRAAVQHGRPGDRHQHGDLLAVGRVDRHWLFHPVQHGEEHRRAIEVITAIPGAAGWA